MQHAPAKIKNLNELLHSQLNTLYSVEKEGKATLTTMAKAATSPAVRKELESAATETTTHVKRLDDVFAAIGAKPSAARSGCIGGLFEDCKASASIEADGNVRDAGMIAMAQAVQHNEIVRYGTAHAWAQALKQDKAGQLLKQTLDEEQASSKRLTELADTVNASAVQHVHA
jgi:ferritin-like metal-binding protein YciE